MKVEIQTTTSKIEIASFGGPDFTLPLNGAMNEVVSHEIKELGQHVLACTVSYSSRHANAHDTANADHHTFRKFYKFSVTNPLSVKTKVHTSRSPSANSDPLEKAKVFLELHIQNMTSDALWFERMVLQPADGWISDDINSLTVDGQRQDLFSGSSALMQPQDIRHYIYALTPESTEAPQTYPLPGSTVPLGRLDITWRSAFGEPGRLLTSMLTRRIPLPLAPTGTLPSISNQPASALPPHLKRTSVPASSPSRPQSPSRTSTPPPFRPSSPATIQTVSAAGNKAKLPLWIKEVDLELSVIHYSRLTVHREFPVTATFRLRASMTCSQARVTQFTVQHDQRPTPFAPPIRAPSPPPSWPPPHQDSVLTASPTQSVFNYPVAHQRLASLSARKQTEPTEHADLQSPQTATQSSRFHEVQDLQSSSRSIPDLGPSCISLPPLNWEALDTMQVQEQDFEVSFMPLKTGLGEISGLSISMEDKRDEQDKGTPVPPSMGEQPSSSASAPLFRKEWGSIAELWVQP